MSFLKRLTGVFGTRSVPSRRKPLGARRPSRKRVYPPKQKRIFKKTLIQAQIKAKEIIIEARDEAFRLKQETESKLQKVRKEIDRLRLKTEKEQAIIAHKKGALEEKDKLLKRQEKQLEDKLEEVEKIKKSEIEKLEKIAALTREKAKDLLIKATENKIASELGRLIQEKEEEIKEKADKKAQEILIEAMRHGATDYVPEYTVSEVKLEGEDIKGRVIGRQGRNIRALEKATGVDFDLDEEGVIRLSCFDSIKREIARVALEILIRDGRIQPSRIEEVVEKTKKDLEIVMRKAGEDLCRKLKVYNLPREVIDVLGRLKYRFSYGQSLIAHTLEETKIGISLANEVGANTNIVRLGCLLHDIGKVITDEEGTHIQVGVDFLKKHGIPQPILDCVAQHHEDEEFSSAESVLVYIADAISGSRPGARYEDYEEYVQRLKELENVAKSFKGVKEAYAIQAGREIRVIVDPEKRNDAATFKLAADIRDKIKKELTYPGQVKVTVIRELRKSEVAN